MSRRRDSNVQGFITVKLLAYDIVTQQYEIEIDNATLIPTKDGSIRLKVPKGHVNQLLINLHDNNQFIKSSPHIKSPIEEANAMNDSEIDHVLDEILETEDDDETDDTENSTTASYSKDENQYLITLKKQLDKEKINTKWCEICSIQSENEYKTDNDKCTHCVQECDCIQRIIFILKYYQLWCQYKAFIELEEDYNDNGYEYLCSMCSFIEILNGYNKIKLINDFIHIKELHKIDRIQLKQYINEIIPNQCEYDQHNGIICQFTNRIHQKAEIYKFSQEHDDLDIIEMYNLNLNNLEYASVDEINEINLQNYLDVVHSYLLHDAMALTKDKYVTKIPNNYVSDTVKLNKSGIVDVANYEFGMFFNYWSVNNHHYAAPKYSTLKQELLNNKLYSISLNDYIVTELKAKNVLDSQYGERLTVKRLFSWMKKNDKLKIGDRISVEHLISLIIYCNYTDLRETFVYMGCFKHNKREKEVDVKKRNIEISNWCRLLMECVYCFGDILSNRMDKLYHGIDCKLSMNRMDFQFDCPLSVTNNISVLVREKKKYKKKYDKNIYLQLERILNSKDICNFYLDLSNLSLFPYENEYIIFGTKLACTDIIFDRLSHKDYILCLRLYQKLICGEWFNENIEYDQELLHDRYQRRLMKMLNQMIYNNKLTNGANKYMRYLCKSITKNVSFGRKMIWLNRSECNKHLLTQFKQILFNPFIKYTLNTYNIKTKFCNILELSINIENNLNKSSRKKTICSREYKYKINGNNINHVIVFHFRCFKQFSKIKNDEMFNGYLGIKTMPKQIGMVKIYGGTYIQQIQNFEKWNYFYLSHSKLNNGGALFTTNKLVNIKNLNIKICFQIWGIVGSDGHSIKL